MSILSGADYAVWATDVFSQMMQGGPQSAPSHLGWVHDETSLISTRLSLPSLLGPSLRGKPPLA